MYENTTCLNKKNRNTRPVPLSSLHLTNQKLSLLVSSRHFFPVDHVPESLDVLGPAVLVFQIIGVFPDI